MEIVLIILGSLLAVSLGLNSFLGWKWHQATVELAHTRSELKSADQRIDDLQDAVNKAALKAAEAIKDYLEKRGG